MESKSLWLSSSISLHLSGEQTNCKPLFGPVDKMQGFWKTQSPTRHGHSWCYQHAQQDSVAVLVHFIHYFYDLKNNHENHSRILTNHGSTLKSHLKCYYPFSACWHIQVCASVPGGHKWQRPQLLPLWPRDQKQRRQSLTFWKATGINWRQSSRNKKRSISQSHLFEMQNSNAWVESA